MSLRPWAFGTPEYFFVEEAMALSMTYQSLWAHWLMHASICVGAQGLRRNSRSHIDASHSQQPLVKGERLVRYKVNVVMSTMAVCACQS